MSESQAQADDVMRAYADSLDFQAIQAQDDWVLLQGTKRP